MTDVKPNEKQYDIEMRKILASLIFLLVGVLLFSSCGVSKQSDVTPKQSDVTPKQSDVTPKQSDVSPEQRLEDACSIVRMVYKSLPDYPNAFDPNKEELKRKYDDFYANVAPDYANKLREAASIFRLLSANNSDMAEYAAAANRFAKALENSGNFAYADHLGLVEFCG